MMRRVGSRLLQPWLASHRMHEDAEREGAPVQPTAARLRKGSAVAAGEPPGAGLPMPPGSTRGVMPARAAAAAPVAGRRAPGGGRPREVHTRAGPGVGLRRAGCASPS